MPNNLLKSFVGHSLKNLFCIDFTEYFLCFFVLLIIKKIVLFVLSLINHVLKEEWSRLKATLAFLYIADIRQVIFSINYYILYHFFTDVLKILSIPQKMSHKQINLFLIFNYVCKNSIEKQ